MDDLKLLKEDEALLYVDAEAWEVVLRNRGGCNCFVAPPCNNCVEAPSEEELNSVGYTYGDATGLGDGDAANN